MKFTLKYSWVLVLLLVLQAVTWTVGLCGVRRSCEYYSLITPHVGYLIDPILVYSLYSIPLGIGLLFAGEKGFKTLVRFAKWWIPLSILVIMYAPESSNSYLPFLELTKKSASTVLGILFSIIGLVIISRKKGSKSIWS